MGQSVIFGISSSACRRHTNFPSWAESTARTDCETRVSCPIADCSLSQRFLTVVRFRNSQTTTCLRASFLRSFERSQALSPTASLQATQKLGAVEIILDDRLMVVTAAHDVVDSTLEFDPWFAWHANNLSAQRGQPNAKNHGLTTRDPQ